MNVPKGSMEPVEELFWVLLCCIHCTALPAQLATLLPDLEHGLSTDMLCLV